MGCPSPTRERSGQGPVPSQKIFLLIFGKLAVFCSKIFLCSGKKGGRVSPSPPKYAAAFHRYQFVIMQSCSNRYAWVRLFDRPTLSSLETRSEALE